MITDEQLDALERRYLPADQQRCVVCGASLTFSSSGSDGRAWSKYVCSSDNASPVRSKLPLRERIEHWDRSTWYDRDAADMAVVELVRAYRELGPQRREPDNIGAGDRWEDPRDTYGGEAG